MNSNDEHIHIFGVRHHGPGSAKALKSELEALAPDIILIEGPTDASHMIEWMGHEELEPPVALVIYKAEDPKQAGYFPFAVFSPEYQAIRYGLSQDLPVRFIDLPQGIMMGANAKLAMPQGELMNQIATAAGYQSYEVWWNDLIEQRFDTTGLFDGISEMMDALRSQDNAVAVPQAIPVDKLLEHIPAEALAKLSPEELEDLKAKQAEAIKKGEDLAEAREAHMRERIRDAQTEGYQKIAVVVGAFHGPAIKKEKLTDAALIANDKELLAQYEAIDVDMAWVPWNYTRLSTYGGYGAGLRSPGWYQHLWDMADMGSESPRESSIAWLSKVGQLLRKEGFATSAAHVLESLRLAESLAAIRDLPFAGLKELNEAIITVLCFGNSTPLQLIQKELVIGERMGTVPIDAPMVPLQRDLYAEQRRLRLRPDAEASTLNLDLRKDEDLERSHLLHRLKLIDVPWGEIVPIRAKSGNYKEIWRLEWKPEFALKVVEASQWGNTVREAALSYAQDQAQKAENLARLTELLDKVILAELPEVIEVLMQQLEDKAALSSDVVHMMAALPPLVRISRYGSVRSTDKGMIDRVVESLVKRICVSLPTATHNIAQDVATDMLEHINRTHDIMLKLRNTEFTTLWQNSLADICDAPKSHGLLAGRSCRILFDAQRLDHDETKLRMQRSLFLEPIANQELEQLMEAAFWLEGFLKGSDLLLLHDESLWDLIDKWVNELEGERFVHMLPLLRKAFSEFSESTRQQIREKLQAEKNSTVVEHKLTREYDEESAKAMLPFIEMILG